MLINQLRTVLLNFDALDQNHILHEKRLIYEITIQKVKLHGFILQWSNGYLKRMMIFFTNLCRICEKYIIPFFFLICWYIKALHGDCTIISEDIKIIDRNLYVHLKTIM